MRLCAGWTPLIPCLELPPRADNIDIGPERRHYLDHQLRWAQGMAELTRAGAGHNPRMLIAAA